MKHSSLHKVTFPETRWTWVIQAGKSGDDPAAGALESLCRMYWRPVYAFLRHWGHSAHDSEDLTQGFFEMLLGSRLFEDASPELGKFRSYLLGALRHFVAKEARAQRTAKRGGGRDVLSLDFSNAEDYLRPKHFDGESPDIAFDRQWAWDLLELTMARLETHYRDMGREAFFDAMKDRLFGDRDGRTIAEAAERLGMEAGAAKVAFHRMKRKYSDMLKDEVARTLGDDSGVEEELRYLISLFSRS